MVYQIKNGNADITIDNDGTRVIEFENKLQLDYPLNIDIRVSTQCSLGYNPKTGKSFCTFCHESARTDGIECDYDQLRMKLNDLPEGIELAIGANSITSDLIYFLGWAKNRGFICNLTVNQVHLKKYEIQLKYLIDKDFIAGLGVSFRSSDILIPKTIKNYSNTVLHVIAGIDSIEEILLLREKLGVRKVLVLGEKDFGFNQGNVELESRKHKEWRWWLGKMFEIFDVVSFDNLALDQLKVKRFFKEDDWLVFNQGEHSFYINAVDGYFAPSSRSNEKTSWDQLTIQEYFKNLENEVR